MSAHKREQMLVVEDGAKGVSIIKCLFFRWTTKMGLYLIGARFN